MVCRDFGMPDLVRRGLAPQEASLQVLLVDIEADLCLLDDREDREDREGERVVWRESAFPVAELAYELALWLRTPAAGVEDFRLDSMSADEALFRLVRSDEGWRTNCAFFPDAWTAPVAWEAVLAELARFDRAVREGVAALGVDPSVIPRQP